MTTEPLDLAEGRRLLEEKQRLEPGIRRAPRAWQDLDATAGFAHAAFMVWLQDNASALLEAAAERDRLRELLREARDCIHSHCQGEHDNRVLADKIDAALSPAAPEEDG